jgi:hypothetical protein
MLGTRLEIPLPEPPYNEGTVVGFQVVDSRFLRINTKQEALDLIVDLQIIVDNWNVS